MFDTMKRLCKPSGRIIMSYQFRENLIGDMPFFDAIQDVFVGSCVDVDGVWIFDWRLKAA